MRKCEGRGLSFFMLTDSCPSFLPFQNEVVALSHGQSLLRIAGVAFFMCIASRAVLANSSVVFANDRILVRAPSAPQGEELPIVTAVRLGESWDDATQTNLILNLIIRNSCTVVDGIRVRREGELLHVEPQYSFTASPGSPCLSVSTPVRLVHHLTTAESRGLPIFAHVGNAARSPL